MSEKSLALYNAVMEKILETLQEIDPDREGNCAERRQWPRVARNLQSNQT